MSDSDSRGEEVSGPEGPNSKEVSLAEEHIPRGWQARTDGFVHRHSDRFAMLSVAESHSELDALPLMLVVFVCLVSAFLGLVVAGLHLMIKEVGCPLGVNGCNSFLGPQLNPKATH